MKKTLLSALMFGSLIVATGALTSCKDYDDDINANTEAIANVRTSLDKVKTDLESEISSLKTQLEAKDAELTTAVQKAQTAADDAKKAAEKEATRAAAAEAALAGRIKTAEETLQKINDALEKDYVKKDDLKDIYAQLEAVQSGLGDQLKSINELKQGLADEETARKAVAADLAQQKEALEQLKSTVATLKATIDVDKINTKIDELTSSIESIQKSLDDKASVADLTKVQNELDAKINKALAQINDLNVLLKQSLRSLVFNPDLYYYGVEGTKLLTLDAKEYTLDAAKYNVEDASTKSDQHYIYHSKDAFQVLSFTANYYMNPSSTDPKSIKGVSLISDDKDFIMGRGAAAGLTVKNYKAENGMLSVDLDVADKSKIKSVLNDKMITVFAAVANIKNGEKDTTITSDFATVVKDEAKFLYIFHKTGEGIPAYNVPNTCDKCLPKCTITTSAGLGHLFQTGYNAGKQYAPQDSCNWNSTLDLRKLVETHYVDVDGKEKVFDATKYGLSYKFELVGLHMGDNKTSESAHAAINPEDGYTFRPQMPNYDKDNVGTQQAYGSKQDRQTIGRTPLVRVSLVDATGKVYAYGYIRIKITEAGKTPEQTKSQYIAYTGDNWSFNQECTAPGFSFNTKWIQTEYDLYNMLGMTRVEFEKGYTPDYKSGNVFKQYVLTAVGTKNVISNPETDQNTTYYTDAAFKAATKEYGTISHVSDAATSEDGTRTSIIRWNMTGAQAYEAMKAGKPVQVAVRYISNIAGKPDVYVVMNTGKVTITKPSATVNWADAIIPNYWYKTNATAGKTGTDEIHANVPTPEDAASRGQNVAYFSDMFSNVFEGNFVSGASLFEKMLTISDNTAKKEYAAKELTIDFIFDKSNNGHQYKGISGTTYTMAVENNGKNLVAKTSPADAGQVVAKITGDNYKNQAATYQETEYAKDLLNYHAHNALDNNTLVAVVGIKAVNKCNKPLEINGKTFDVRFLRPINVKDNGAEIEDANITKVQEIKMSDLVLFNDFRDAWDNKQDVWMPYTYNAGYTKYYGIKSIKVDGVSNGQRISLNTKVTTSLGNQDANEINKTLKSVSDQVDFYYIENSTTDMSKNVLRYTNLSSTLSAFKVKVPVTVEYYWGKIHTYAVINVKSSVHNAKRH